MNQRLLVPGRVPLAGDPVRDVPGVGDAGSERAHRGPGAPLPVEHLALQGPAAHGTP